MTPSGSEQHSIFEHILVPLDGSPLAEAANPAVSVHLESAEDAVIIEGVIEDLPADEGYLAEQIVTAWDARYGRLHSNPVGSGIFRLTPKRARGWSASTLRDGTRWEVVE